MAQTTLEQILTLSCIREMPTPLTHPKRGKTKAATSHSTNKAGGQTSDTCSTTQSIWQGRIGPGALKPDPGKATTPIDRAKAKGSRIPSPNSEIKWTSPPLLKLRTSAGKGVSEASSDATIPARKQVTQPPATPMDEKPQLLSKASMVIVQEIDTMLEVDDLNIYTGDEPPECDAAQMSRENAIWSIYGVT
jgi:hypothetical protein